MSLTADQIYELNHMNNVSFKCGLGTAIAAMEAAALGGALADGHIIVGSALGVATDVAMSGVVSITRAGVTAIADAALDFGKIAQANHAVTTGTILSAIKLTPTASTTTTSINYHKLLCVGDETGTTAYGFGDPAKPTTGIMACFGRTLETSGALTDTGLDVRVINKLTNVGAYVMQGAYIKCKNYSGATVGSIVGLFVEAVADGTVSTSAIGLKIGSDATSLTTAIDLSTCVVTNGADIKMSSGATIGSGTGVPSFTAIQGSFYIRTGQTVNATYYYNNNGSTGWTLLNALA
jgi:hypothetical protein